MTKYTWFLCGIWVLFCAPLSAQTQQKHTAYQVSTIHTLFAGGYDGIASIGDMKNKGNFGLGTFHALDGEMIFLDNICYKVRANGRVTQVPDNETTPFFTVTAFQPGQETAVMAVQDYAQFKARLATILPSPEFFYAIKITGHFHALTTRSVPIQSKPYPTLDKVVAIQRTFSLNNIVGTMVGFYCPDYASGVNVPGFHFHFISQDKTAGGHVLAMTTTEPVSVAIDTITAWHMMLPDTMPTQPTHVVSAKRLAHVE